MKKTLFVVAVAAIAMTACTNEKNEYVGDNTPKEIAFRPMNQSMTRSGAVIGGAAFPYSMDVVAYSYVNESNKGDYFGNKSTGAGVVFSQVGSGTTWSGSQYWPLSPCTLNFLAVSKSNVSGATVSTLFGTSDGQTTPTYSNLAEKAQVTLSSNYQTSGAQIDLMYGTAQGQVSQSGNTWTYPGPVSMSFQHALAWVNFTVKAATAAAEAITVKEIKVKQGYYDGVFNVKTSNWNTATAPSFVDADTKWSSVGTATDHIVPVTSAVSLSGTSAGSAATFGDGLLLVPTSELTSTASFTNFDITYSLNGNDYTFTYNVAPTLAKGTKYTYNITFTLTEILITPTVSAWGDGGSTPVAVQ